MTSVEQRLHGILTPSPQNARTPQTGRYRSSPVPGGDECNEEAEATRSMDLPRLRGPPQGWSVSTKAGRDPSTRYARSG